MILDEIPPPEDFAMHIIGDMDPALMREELLAYFAVALRETDEDTLKKAIVSHRTQAFQARLLKEANVTPSILDIFRGMSSDD